MTKNSLTHLLAYSLLVALAACSKSDPILPGERTPIFSTPKIENRTVPDKVLNCAEETNTACSTNRPSLFHQFGDEIWKQGGDGKKGTLVYAAYSQYPIDTSKDRSSFGVCCASDAERRNWPTNVDIDYENLFGFSNGEVAKFSKNGKLLWTASVMKENSITGGWHVPQVAPITVVSENGKCGGRRGTFVYAVSMGEALCKLDFATGKKIWCAEVSSERAPAVSYVSNLVFILSPDKHLYAIDSNSGEIYWRVKSKHSSQPEFAYYTKDDLTVRVCRGLEDCEHFNFATGEKRK